MFFLRVTHWAFWLGVVASGLPRDLAGPHTPDTSNVVSRTPINEGNSGGPVVDDRGAVVGIMTFVLRDAQGLAFALPISYAMRRFAGSLPLGGIDIGRFEHYLAMRGAWPTLSGSATRSRSANPPRS